MTKPKEGAITTKEGNKFIYLQGKWYRPSEIPSELKGSETVKKALAKPAAKPKEGAITTKEGNKFIYLQGRWYRPSEIPSELKGSETVKKALGKPAAKPAASKPAPAKPKAKPAAKPAPAKPKAKPASKPTAKPKRPSLKEQVADLKKSGTGSQRFKEMAEKARKEMMERRKRTQQRGSRKPGSMY